AGAQLVSSIPEQPAFRPGELAAEPKVQIDPTLIEPLPVHPIPGPPPLGAIGPPDTRLRPMPSDLPAHPVPLENPFLHSPSSPEMQPTGPAQAPPAIEAPPMNMMMAVAQSNPFMAQHGHPAMAPGSGVYPPEYAPAMVPTPRYLSDVALPTPTGNRRVIVVL